MFDEQGGPRIYANILLSTDGSDVARKGVRHGIALAKALNAKVTLITVTEPLEIDYGSGHASGWFPSQEEVDRFDAACKERAGKVLDEARAMAEQIGTSAELFACSECAPSHRDYRNSKVQRLRHDRHGLSWASRPQEACVGESNVGGSRRRKRAGVGSALKAFQHEPSLQL
jgi:nucleotide-binding universal stress UspA family protein